MLTAYESADVRTLRRKARSFELQAGRSSPTLAAQLHALAAQYYSAAEALDIDMTKAAAAWRSRRPEPCSRAPGASVAPVTPRSAWSRHATHAK